MSSGLAPTGRSLGPTGRRREQVGRERSGNPPRHRAGRRVVFDPSAHIAREGGTLLTCELPSPEQRNHYAGKVGQAVRAAGYTFYVGHRALRRVESYRMSTRVLAVARARARGVYDRLPGLRIIREVTRAGRVHWSSRDGGAGESVLGRLTAATRLGSA
ncbi:hypothetical protein E4N62_20420 [Streptomyces sp. MNU76]|uniref:hypothetical protein n=1 Tax=Streptomyces sp. MNU76 TaxID=2560026 RepID=UPI001E4702F1|nr:hypothetical protein [Streptomyces sp. MNU76]MCC9707435.1 hypothetical protein [Streptomyces sp. MNU76]